MASQPHTATSENNSKSSRKITLKKSELASRACERGKYEEAALLYTEALALDPSNHVLYTNRSAVYIKTKQYGLALEDGRKAVELQPNWQKAHYRQAVALQCMGKYHESLAAFASAIAHDQKGQQLLVGFIDAALKSPLKESLEKILSRLKQVNMDQNPFVVVSIVGQELLNAGHVQPAITCLENALKIGTVGLRMRGSVISALTSAYWKMGNVTRSVELMQEDLDICRSLGDHDGECRVLGNLGNSYFSMKKHEEALAAHHSQLMVASKSKNKKAAAAALTSLAHVYVSRADYTNAIESHNKAIDFHRQLKNSLAEAHELGNLGAVYLLAGDCENSIKCHEEQLRLAKSVKHNQETALAYSNLGCAQNEKGNYEEAAKLHSQVLSIAEDLSDASLEGRACAGLGRAYRSLGTLAKAMTYYERQQAVAVKLKDRVMEGRALSSLGIIYLEQGECLQALKLHKVHLAICQEFGDRAGQGQAYGNMGCAYSALKKYEQAIKLHEKELEISKEVGDVTSEACTHGNLAVAYQGLGKQDEARRHYEQHLAVSRGAGDTHNEGVALFNLGNFYSASGNFRKAVAFYEKYLTLTQKSGDEKGENKACHNLAFAQYSLGNVNEAAILYARNIELARTVGDKNSLARAYCNLGLIHKDLGDYQNALRCQTSFQATSKDMRHPTGECRALGNIGDIYLKTKRTREAVGCYEKQVTMAERLKDKALISQAYGALGNAYKILGRPEKAMTCHTKELAVHRESGGDARGLFKALDHIGMDSLTSEKLDQAFEYFSEQLGIAERTKDQLLCAKANGNLGLVKLRGGEYHEAMTFFRNQIDVMERVSSTGSLELGRAQGNLAECLLMRNEFEAAKEKYELYLAAAKKAAVPTDQDKAYRGLGNAFRGLGNMQQALFCFESRLVFAHELSESSVKCSAYGELGNLHRTMGNYEQATVCYTQQLKLAKDCEDHESEADAECGLGEVYCKMGDYGTALSHHENDLRLADQLHSSVKQSRAFGNLGLVYELMGNHKKASECQEQNLSIAAQASDRVGKVAAYSSLGRNHYCMTNFAQSISYLKQGLTIAETLGKTEDEAIIRYWLGVALCAGKEVTSSLEQLYKAADLYESLRDAWLGSNRFELAMHDQQALCYQVLQRVLIDLGRREEALVVAERARARDFVDYLLHKQNGQRTNAGKHVTLNSYDQIMDVVNRQNGYFICYSLVLRYLCIWLIVPQHGIVKFHELRLSDEMPELMVHAGNSRVSHAGNSRLDHAGNSRVIHAGSTHASGEESLLERLIGQVREDIGVEPACGSSVSTMSSSLSGSDLDEPWERNSYDETPKQRSRRSSDNSNTSSAHSPFSYLKSGLLRKGLRKLNGVRHDTHRSAEKRKDWLMRPPVEVLYETLIAPVEEFLPRSPQPDGSLCDLVLVPQGDLFLVPFPLLKSGHSKDHLHKRFSLITVPSIHSLSSLPTLVYEKPPSSRIVVGDPHLPLSLDQFRSPTSAEHETELVGTLFGTKPLVGSHASKEVVCRKAKEAECIHFATTTSWKHSAIVLGPSKDAGHVGIEGSSGTIENFLPSPADFLLTASEICHMRFPAKMVVLGCRQNESRNKMSLDGLLSLVRSFLQAGTSCVLVSLWPVPEPAYKLLLQGFYKRFLRGMRASRALAHAVKLVESNKEFDHPSNWAGFILVGRDVKVVRKTVQLREALVVMIESTSNCREALKVLLHLVDKANQRLLDNNTSLMYTAETSVANKLGDAQGWRDVFTAAGFRFRKAAKSLPDSIFFPLKDDKGKLRQCGDILRALLGLSPTTLHAISKVLSTPSLVKALLELFNSVLSSFAKGLNNVQVPLQLKLWRMTGCHELLASMGFDLLGVGKDEVMLRSGGANSRRALQCSVVALNTLTGGLGTDNTELAGEFPLRRSGSESSLKSSISTISSFSYASTERTLEAAKSYHSSRRSHVSDVESILDDLDQEESSVDPDVPGETPDDIPIDSDSRALSLHKKTPSHDSSDGRARTLHKKSNSKSSDHGGTRALHDTSTTNGMSPQANGVSSVSSASGFLDIPRNRNGVSDRVASWEYTSSSKSPANGWDYSHARGSSAHARESSSHVRDYSDSVDSATGSLSMTSGDDENKTPGSINSMQRMKDVTATIDRSPQMRRGNLRRGVPIPESKLNGSRDSSVGTRVRSVSFESVVDEINDSDDNNNDRRTKTRLNDVETFHAVIQTTRGTRKDHTRKNTRGTSNLNKSYSRSDDEILVCGSLPTRMPHEVSYDIDSDSVFSDGQYEPAVNSDNSVIVSGTPRRKDNKQQRKRQTEHLVNLKNLHASAC